MNPSIHRTFELLKKVNQPNVVHISELAQELDLKKTKLMQLILDNPKLFITCNDTNGAVITLIYTSIDQNPYTQECLDKLKEEYQNTLHVDHDAHMDYYYLTDLLPFPIYTTKLS